CKIHFFGNDLPSDHMTLRGSSKLDAELLHSFQFHVFLAPYPVVYGVQERMRGYPVRRQPKSKGLLDITRADLDVASHGAGSGDMPCRSGDPGELRGSKGHPCWFACFGAGERLEFLYFIQ